MAVYKSTNFGALVIKGSAHLSGLLQGTVHDPAASSILRSMLERQCFIPSQI
jgi:hypothetical protein